MNRSLVRRPSLATKLVYLVAMSPGIAAVVACGPDGSAPITQASQDAVTVDQVEIVHGVADHGRDPAVVAVDIGGDALCTGSLISPNVVLTARHCVSQTSEEVACPADGKQIVADQKPSDLAIYAGDDIQHLSILGRGQEILTPDSDVLCDHDIGLVILDRAVDGVAPLDIRKDDVVVGERLRAVGFGKSGDESSAGTKLLREHVAVLEVDASEFQVGESTCNGDSGGPALDESSGEIIGVVSRGGPTCEGKDARNIYTRVSAFQDLIARALAHGEAALGRKKPKDPAPKPGKPASDMGQGCTSASDCSTGMCVRAISKPPMAYAKQYCSRSCGAGDRCPAHYHCQAQNGGSSVCLATGS